MVNILKIMSLIKKIKKVFCMWVIPFPPCFAEGENIWEICPHKRNFSFLGELKITNCSLLFFWEMEEMRGLLGEITLMSKKNKILQKSVNFF
jgi:hypothetical protein